MRKKLYLGFCVLMFTVLTSVAQTVTVTGKVTDDKGAPVPGATIFEKGTKNATSASNDGIYNFKVKPGATLIISAIGFVGQQMTAGPNLLIKLVTDVSSLGEVVVTGSGVATSKRRLGISVESIKSDKLPIVPAAGIDQALIGKIPGAQISSVSGNPGDQVNIVLRGINTVSGGTRPLILLDGVEIPFSNLNTLDLNQMDRVEVVQGAASATIYGAQGANGVIQIFSKKGIKGKVSINVSSSYADNKFINAGDFGKATLHPYLTNASGELVSQLNSGGFSAGQTLKVDPTLGFIRGSGSIAYQYGNNIPGITFAPGQGSNYTRYGILDPRNNANKPYAGNGLTYHDHFAEAFTGSQSVNHSLSISGGAEKSDFNIAFSNNKTTSPFLKNNGDLNRSNLTANLGVELFKGFTIRAITNISYITNNMHPGLGAPGGVGFGQGERNADVGTVYGFLNTSPFFSLLDTIAGGAYAYYQRASFLSVNAYNPYYQKSYTTGDSKQYNILQNLQANYKINKFVTLNAKYGVSFKNENDIHTFYNQSLNESSNYWGGWAAAYNSADNTGEIVNYQYNNTKQNFLATALITTDFEKDFGFKFPLQTSTQIGFDYRKNLYKEYDTRGQSLPLNPPFNVNATQSQYIISDYVEPFVTYGYLLDQKFDVGNYGGVTVGFRTDYSSSFGSGSTPFTFPHYNGYLNLESFKFWDGISKVLPAVKFRAAYGEAGIQPSPFDRYPTLNSQPTGNEVAYTNQTGQKNPALGVEVSSETEFGTDFTVNVNKSNWLKNINVNLSYWTRKTDNAIFYQNVPPSTGATSLLTNAIALSSKGWQLGINIPVYASKNLTWDLTTNLSHQTSTIDNVVGGDIPLTTSAGSSGLILAAGRKIGEIYGYKALTDVAQVRADGKTPFIASGNQAGYEIVNGRVVNKSSKAIFFSDEAESLGDPNPTLVASFINSFNYKSCVTLAFQFDWINGSHLYNQTKEWMYRDGISNDYNKPVTINGETGNFTAYYASAYYGLGSTPRGVGNNVTKDFFYYDASFVRLRNVSLGIDFAKFAKQNWLKKCQLVFSGRNLLTFTNYPGLDPEISSGTSNSAFDRGIDHSTIPNMKSYQVSLNLGF